MTHGEYKESRPGPERIQPAAKEGGESSRGPASRRWRLPRSLGLVYSPYLGLLLAAEDCWTFWSHCTDCSGANVNPSPAENSMSSATEEYCRKFCSFWKLPVLPNCSGATQLLELLPELST